MTHTPLPWKLDEDALAEGVLISTVNKIEQDDYNETTGLAIVKSWCNVPDDKTKKGNAEFIVRAVNNHYDLINALKGLVSSSMYRDHPTESEIAISLLEKLGEKL